MAAIDRRFTCILVATAICVTLPSVAVADETLEEPRYPTPVSAYGNAVAWSKYDGNRGWVLMLRVGDVVSEAPVTPRDRAFDVDLGPDAKGETVAVYSRCARGANYDGTGLVGYGGTRCAIYQLDVTRGVERRVRRVRGQAADYMPSIWRDRLAFARLERGRRTPRIYVKSPGTEARRLPGGPRGRGSAWVSRLDLRGARLALGWAYIRRASAVDPTEPGPGPNLITSVRVATLGGRQTLVDSVRSGQDGRRLAQPSLYAGRVHYGLDNQFRTYRLRTRARTRAPAPESIGRLLSLAVSQVGVVYSKFIYGGRGFDCWSEQGSCRVAIRPGGMTSNRERSTIASDVP